MYLLFYLFIIVFSIRIAILSLSIFIKKKLLIIEKIFNILKILLCLLILLFLISIILFLVYKIFYIIIHFSSIFTFPKAQAIEEPDSNIINAIILKQIELNSINFDIAKITDDILEKQRQLNLLTARRELDRRFRGISLEIAEKIGEINILLNKIDIVCKNICDISQEIREIKNQIINSNIFYKKE